MERTASALPFSSVCLLGDNFYPHGVQSIDDPQWSGFERAFAGPHLAVPFHAALGNHDHHGNVEAQVEYSATSSRWRMPGQYYSFVERAGEGFDAEFFVLDTECIRREERASTEQLRWFEDKLSRSRVRWKIVVGHHPVRSNGEHGGIDRVRDAIEDLMHDHGVALYLFGPRPRPRAARDGARLPAGRQRGRIEHARHVLGARHALRVRRAGLRLGRARAGPAPAGLRRRSPRSALRSQLRAAGAGRAGACCL
jgi:acid phosphatase